jgi:hypothetical protein
MYPILFDEHNLMLTPPTDKAGHEHKDVSNLPVYRGQGRVISCWRPTLRETISLLFHRRVWFMIWAERTSPPITLMAKKTVFGDVPNAAYTKRRCRVWAAGCVALVAMVVAGVVGVRCSSAGAAGLVSTAQMEASVQIPVLSGALVSPGDAPGPSPYTAAATDDGPPVSTALWRWTAASGPVAYYRACLARPGTPLPPLVAPDTEKLASTAWVACGTTLNGAVFHLTVQACEDTHKCGPWSEPGRVVALPEPGVLLMLLSGVSGLALLEALRRRRMSR